jgi:hypothetical protein
MKAIIRSILIPAVVLTVLGTAVPLPTAPGKEFLTPKEIEQIQDAQEIDRRVKVYLEAAALRLKTAEDRLGGKEAEPGDPLEFNTVEEMVDAYYRILKSVMINLDDAYQKPQADREKLSKALKELKSSTEWAGKVLISLKKTAEEKQKEELWNLVNQSIDITNGAREGAELGLSKSPPTRPKGKGKSLK